MQYRFAVNFGTFSTTTNPWSLVRMSMNMTCYIVYDSAYRKSLLKQMQYRFAVNFGTFSTTTTPGPKIYLKSVLHLLKYTANLYHSRCSTELR